MTWYNIWSQRPYSIYLMHLATEATVSGFKKLFPKSKIKIGANYWNNGLNEYYYKEKELADTVDEILNKAIESSTFLNKFLKKALVLSVEMRKYTGRLKLSELDSKDSEELVKIIEEFGEQFLKMYSYGTLVSLFGYFQENPVNDRMEKILKDKIGNNPTLISKYLLTLTSPLKLLKPNEQELEILKIAKKAKKLKLKNKKEIKKQLFEDLNKIKDDFEWLSFDLCNSLSWDLDHYANLVLEKLDTNIEKRIKELKNYEKNTEKQTKDLFKKLLISKDEQKFFKTVRDIGYYKWAREYEFMKALYNLKFVQDELGKRIGITSLESKCLLYNEYRPALKQKNKYKKIVKQRLNNCLIINKGNRTVVFAGREAMREYKKLQFQKKVYERSKTINGSPAYLGKVKGIVRIINIKEDMNKMKKGNILVSQATNPDLLPAMKKAAAIVTNEGGITCHAAIVSRELKIPCVVGVKIATKVLKDGGLVEVDANKGVVKIL